MRNRHIGTLTRSARAQDRTSTSTAARASARAIALLLCVAGCTAIVGAAPALAVVGRFGSEGPGAGQFQQPRGIAVEQESGSVYVVDRNQNRVEKFGGEGAFTLAWGWGVADGHTEAPQTCSARCFPGIEGAGAGQLGFPEDGVAVDNDPLSPSYRDVYVFDSRNHRVEKFDSAGNFLLMFGGEVNATTKGNVCLAGEACAAGVEGPGTGEFQRTSGEIIAVDSAGTVYVGDENRVQKFTPGGAYEGQIALPGAGSIEALAVDPSDDVYIESSELNGVRKYDGAGTELGEPRDASNEPGVIAVGPAGELFIDGPANREPHHHLLEYDPAGDELASFDAGPESGSSGIAFNGGTDELYVLETRAVRVVSLPPPGPLVLAGSESVDEPQPTTATLDATLNPEGDETSYRFEYGTSVAYGASTALTALPASFEDQPVSMGLSGLQPRTTYHFRLRASNSAGTTFGPDETFTTLPPVLIDSESASQVTATSVLLAAQIDPLGLDTRYRFEYGPSPAYGSSVPVSDGDVGSGTVDVASSVQVEGLAPGTAYHYRVVASNSLGTVDGPDRVFGTQGTQAQGLPDGRAWELVSPVNKHGASLEAIDTFEGGSIQAARNGEAITYLASAPTEARPAGNRSLQFTQVLSTRASDGWSSRDLTVPDETVVGLGAEYRFFSDDLSAALVQPEGETSLSPDASEETPYRREADGEYKPLVTAANVPTGTAFGGTLTFADATADLGHVVLESTQALTTPAFAAGGHQSLYEWVGGSLRLVSILPNGRPAAVEGDESALGAPNNAGSGNVRHAISDDGSRVFWVAGGHLYMRDLSKGKTVQIDAVEEGGLGGIGQAIFQTASSDGSKVFFTDASRLTADATSLDPKADLYMCEIAEAAGTPVCRLKDLTVDGNPNEAADVGAGAGQVIGAGEDGRLVYFVANGVLAPGAAPGDCTSRAAGGAGVACSLYVSDTVSGETRFIARLSNQDGSDWEVPGNNLSWLTSKVSPNGRYLAFMSDGSLTGYDNIDAHSGDPDEEVFLYDAGTGRMVCASCDPTGARPAGVFDRGGNSRLLVDQFGSWAGHWLAASLPGWTFGKIR